MLCVRNLNALIKSLENKGYKVKYKNKVWTIDGEIVDENKIPELLNGDKTSQLVIMNGKRGKKSDYNKSTK